VMLTGNIPAGSDSVCCFSIGLTPVIPIGALLIGLWSTLPTVLSVAATPKCSNVLYNGVCVPHDGFPAADLDHDQAFAGDPPYLTPCTTPEQVGCRPPIINITLGRQLFVDDFLIDLSRSSVRADGPSVVPLQPSSAPPTTVGGTTVGGTTNNRGGLWRLAYHQVQLDPAPMIVPDQPWEKVCAKAYSGGAWCVFSSLSGSQPPLATNPRCAKAYSAGA
jgi:hypothetical protein